MYFGCGRSGHAVARATVLSPVIVQSFCSHLKAAAANVVIHRVLCARASQQEIHIKYSASQGPGETTLDSLQYCSIQESIQAKALDSKKTQNFALATKAHNLDKGLRDSRDSDSATIA